MKKINKIVGIVLCIIGLLIVNKIGIKVNAEGTYNSSLTVSSTKVQPGSTIEVYLNLSNLPSAGLGAATYFIGYDSNLVEYISNSNSQFTVTNTGTQIKLTFVDVGKLTGNPNPLKSGTSLNFKTKGEGTVNFTLSSTGTSVAETGENITSINSGTSVTIKQPSTVNHLEKLYSTSGESLGIFSKDTLNYNVTTDKDEISLTAVYAEGGTVTTSIWTCDTSTRRCTTTRKLNYGNNEIIIQIKSEANVQKTYTINVYRNDNRDTDATLSDINGVPNFQKNKYVYDIEIPTSQGVFIVEPTASRPLTSKISLSTDKKITLNYGETKSVVITVTAENGNVLRYTLNITRKDNRSSNNYLKSLTVDKGSINFAKDNYSYRIVVEHDIKNIAITAVAEDKKSRVEGLGSKPLSIGSNVFRVTVIAENESKKIYTITVVRKDKNNDTSKLSRNTNINRLTLNGEPVNLIPGIYTYALSVENHVTKAEFFCEPEDPKTIVMLDGDRNLKVGVNKFKVIVTAENGNNVVYDIVVERKELRKTFSNNKEDILNGINNSTESVITVTVPYNDKNRIVTSDILTALKNTNKTIVFEVLNENRGLYYSVTIVGNKITNVSDFNFDLDFTTENKEIIDNLSNSKKTVYIDLIENTGLKGSISIKVYVGDKFDITNTLTLYYFDKTNNKLDLIIDNLLVKNSYVEIDIDKISEYILMDKKLVNKTQTTEVSSDSGMLLIIGIVAVVVIAIIIIIISKNKPKKIVKPTIPTTTNEINSNISSVSVENNSLNNTNHNNESNSVN